MKLTSEQIKKLNGLHWYHTIKLNSDYQTHGEFNWEPYFKQIPWGTLKGRKVLDVGAGDGYFSFKLEQLGAKVTAVDIVSPAQIDCFKLLMTTPKPKGKSQHRKNFLVLKDLFSSQVKHIEADLYGLKKKEIGEFDLVFCNDVLLHLSDPVRALSVMKSLSMGQVLVGTVIQEFENQGNLLAKWSAKYLRLDSQSIATYNGAFGNMAFWLPTMKALKNMVISVGLTITQDKIIRMSQSDCKHVMPRGFIQCRK